MCVLLYSCLLTMESVKLEEADNPGQSKASETEKEFARNAMERRVPDYISFYTQKLHSQKAFNGRKSGSIKQRTLLSAR